MSFLFSCRRGECQETFIPLQQCRLVPRPSPPRPSLLKRHLGSRCQTSAKSFVAYQGSLTGRQHHTQLSLSLHLMVWGSARHHNAMSATFNRHTASSASTVPYKVYLCSLSLGAPTQPHAHTHVISNGCHFSAIDATSFLSHQRYFSSFSTRGKSPQRCFPSLVPPHALPIPPLSTALGEKKWHFSS